MIQHYQIRIISSFLPHICPNLTWCSSQQAYNLSFVDFFQNVCLKWRKWVKFWSLEKICDGLTGFCDGLTGLILLHKRQMRFCTREMWRINGDDGLTGDGLTGFHCSSNKRQPVAGVSSGRCQPVSAGVSRPILASSFDAIGSCFQLLYVLT